MAANVFLIVAAAVLLLLSAYFVAAHKPLYVRVAPVILALGSLALLVVNAKLRVIAASVMLGALVGLYATELISRVLYNDDLPFRDGVTKAAAEAGIQYDPRTRMEAILEYRDQGIHAYPPFYPYLLVDAPLKVNGQPTIPLGGHSGVFAVVCNEGGQYLTYNTDEHGFPNPKGIWQSSPVDVAMVGASNTTGECVPQADSPAGQLRTVFPSVITLGAGGNGPLFALASIREYLHYLKPKRVLWSYAESHSPQYLEIESHSSLMQRYLDDPSFSQGLIDKQPALDSAIAAYVESGIRQSLRDHSWPTSLKNFLILKNVRTLEFEFRARLHPPKPVELNTSLLERILRQGSKEVKSWGGELTLVYEPDPARYRGIASYTPALRLEDDARRRIVLDMAARLGIKVIDLTTAFPDLPAERASENAKYFYSFPAHYKPEGYRTVGKALQSALKNDH